VGNAPLRKRGRIWHIEATIRGRRIRESCETEDRAHAIALARQRIAELEQTGPVALRAPKLTFEQLAADFIRDYEINGRRSVGKAKKSVEKLAEVFAGWKAINITAADVRGYVEKRQEQKFSNATINRELAALRRMFKLAVRAKILTPSQVPSFEILQEAPPRSGFFEPEMFRSVHRYLRPEVKPIALFAYELGWRLREIITLQWRQLNLDEGYARLDPGTTKNREGRIAYLSPALLAVLKSQAAATKELERAKGKIIPWVFHRQGSRILRFNASWRTACRNAGVPGMLFHDLRRTAVRNMVRAGIPERVAMQISGHKTRSVFERYNIVSEGDLREAAHRLASYGQSNGTAAAQVVHLGRTATHQRSP